MFPLQRRKHNPLKKWESAKPSTRDYRNWKSINVSEKNQTKPTRETSWILSPSTRYDLVHLHSLPQCYWERKKYEHHYISQAFIAARDEGQPQAEHFYSPVKIFFFWDWEKISVTIISYLECHVLQRAESQLASPHTSSLHLPPLCTLMGWPLTALPTPPERGDPPSTCSFSVRPTKQAAPALIFSLSLISDYFVSCKINPKIKSCLLTAFWCHSYQCQES